MNAARQALHTWIGPLLIAMVFVAMTAWTWGTWPDPIVDFGREIYIAWQLADGKVLYRDIPHFNGPLSAYLNALVFKLTGPGLRWMVIANLLILIALVVMVHRLWMFIAGRLAATVACLVLVSVFAFLRLSGIGNYNFVTPYSHEITHGIVLSFAALMCLKRHLATGRRSWLAATGAMLGLVSQTKVEVLAAAMIGVGIGAILSIATHENTMRSRLAAACGFASALLLAPLATTLFLWSQMPPNDALRGMVGSWLYVFDARLTEMRFYRRAMGTLDTLESVRALIVQSAICATLVLVASWIAFRVRSRRAPLVAAILGTLGMAAVFQFAPAAWERAFRGVIVMMLVAVGVSAAGVIRDPSPRRILQLATAAFAAALLAKIALNVRTQHYGFSLAMPSILMLIVAALAWLPRWLDARGANGAMFRAIALPAIGLFVFIHVRAHALVFSNLPYTVGGGVDAFRADARGDSVNRIVATIDKLDPGATLAVIPEGALINYLVRRENPTGYVNLMPPEVLMFGQSRIVEAFERRPPDFVLLVESHPYDYGYRVVENYARDVDQLVRNNYTPIDSPPHLSPPMVLMRRNDHAGRDR